MASCLLRWEAVGSADDMSVLVASIERQHGQVEGREGVHTLNVVYQEVLRELQQQLNCSSSACSVEPSDSQLIAVADALTVSADLCVEDSGQGTTSSVACDLQDDVYPTDNLRWGSPRDATFSWLFVPLIRAALGMDPGKRYEAQFWAGEERWNMWVAAYRRDFKERGVAAASVECNGSGYIEAAVQEFLLYTDNPMYDIHGSSGVDYNVQNQLMAFGAEFHAQYIRQ